MTHRQETVALSAIIALFGVLCLVVMARADTPGSQQISAAVGSQSCAITIAPSGRVSGQCSTATATPSPTPTPSATPTATPSATASPSPTPTATPVSGGYPWHTGIVVTTAWVGELFDAHASDGSQVCSAYDSQWAFDFSGVNIGPAPGGTSCAGAPMGGCDGISSGTKPGNFTCQTERTSAANGYFPLHMTPLENPFYLDLPFDDVNNAQAFAQRCAVVPWAQQMDPSGAHCADKTFSYMKNMAVELVGANGQHCIGQVEDAGPHEYDDTAYVFGANDARPHSRAFNGAGMDISPALRDCLGINQLNGDTATADWRFIDPAQVPDGPWKTIWTTSGVK